MNILFVENLDDHYGEAKTALLRELPWLKFKRLCSEGAFYQWLEDTKADELAPVDAIILDWRLPWDVGEHEMVPPGDLGSVDFAGFRCLKRLEESRWSWLQVIIYTAMGVEDIEPLLSDLIKKPQVLEKGDASKLVRVLVRAHRAGTT